jgi:hypothetical protein
MTHTIIYLGNLDDNSKRLLDHNRVRGFRRIDSKGRERDIDPPSDLVDGIVFWYMEDGRKSLPKEKAFFAVAVEDVVLRQRVLLVPAKHTDGKWFGPSASQFGDESARALLNDMISANPDQADQLRSLLEQLEPRPDPRGSGPPTR